MVPRAKGYDAAWVFRAIESRDFVVSAAKLERARVLHALDLEKGPTSNQARKGDVLDERGFDRDADELAARRDDIAVGRLRPSHQILPQLLILGMLYPRASISRISGFGHR